MKATAGFHFKSMSKNMHGFTFENITGAAFWRMVYREMRYEEGDMEAGSCLSFIR